MSACDYDVRPAQVVGTLASAPALLLLGSSVFARLPLAMFSIALLVHTQHLTGSFGAAGVVTGAYAVAAGAGGPLLGRAVDRLGQTLPLLGAAGTAAALLAAIAVLPRSTPVAVLATVAFGIGLATPPLGACVRTLLPQLIHDQRALRSAYAVESSALELTFIFGPPLALMLGVVWSTGAALAVSGLVLLAATAWFASQPASNGWRPAQAVPSAGPNSLGAAGLRTLVLVLTAVGLVFGAVEVGVTAAAQDLGGLSAAGPLLAAWGVGSLCGGIATARFGGGVRGARALALVLGALAAAHLCLAVVFDNRLGLAAVLFAAGATIAPTYSSVYGMVEALAPAGAVTEAFAWLSTAIAVGTAAGAATAGTLVDRFGPAATFVLAGVAGSLAVALTIARRSSLAET